MEITIWLTYLGVIIALIAIPGPSSLLITLHGYKYGLKKTNSTIVGNVLGSFILMAISSTGLSALLSTSETLFLITKYLGAAYLIFLGIKTWRNSAMDNNINPVSAPRVESTFTIFKQGFFTGVSNPKDLLFFAALFPAFLSPQQPLLVQLSILMLTWLVVDYLMKVLYVMVGKRLKDKFSNPNFLRNFNRFTGSLFFGFGILIAGTNKQ